MKKNVNELRSSNASLKADVEKSVKELKSNMKTAIKSSHDELMGRVRECESRVEKTEKSIAVILEMVKTVAHKMSESSEKLKGVDERVTENSASISVLKSSVRTLKEQKDEQPASRSSSQLPPSDNGSSIAKPASTLRSHLDQLSFS